MLYHKADPWGIRFSGSLEENTLYPSYSSSEGHRSVWRTPLQGPLPKTPGSLAKPQLRLKYPEFPGCLLVSLSSCHHRLPELGEWGSGAETHVVTPSWCPQSYPLGSSSFPAPLDPYFLSCGLWSPNRADSFCCTFRVSRTLSWWLHTSVITGFTV